MDTATVAPELDLDDLEFTFEDVPEVPAVRRPETAVRRVLVAEDDPDTAARCVKAIRRLGLEPVVVPNGREALELLDRPNEPFALAYVDVALPDVSARALAEHARHRRGAMPVVFATDDLLDVLTAPGVVLARPFTADEFERAFDAALLFEEPPADEPTWIHGGEAVWEDERESA